MTTFINIHRKHLVLESNLRFYSLEINFLLKILAREYAIVISKEKIKLLDTFWKEFEKYDKKLKALSNEIRQYEENAFLIDGNSYEDTLRKECMMKTFSCIVEQLKSLEETLYVYLSNNLSKE